jgi:NADPH-dependent glutamate synthase beta subunit-like oxidoreductase
MRLNMLGFHVTVFERSDRPGGLLMYGIPNMKLDKRIVERRVKLMEELGITFKCGVDVGKDVTIDELKEDFDAVAICAGASKPRDLSIPGREYKNIRFAVEYLAETTKQLMEDGPDSLDGTLEGKNVIVIGGGDTGNDCVGTSLRRGAKNVTQFEIMPEPPSERQPSNPWPQWPAVKKTDYGQEEAIYLQGEDPRIYLINSVRFTGDENGVTGIDTVKVTWQRTTLWAALRCPTRWAQAMRQVTRRSLWRVTCAADSRW